VEIRGFAVDNLLHPSIERVVGILAPNHAARSHADQPVALIVFERPNPVGYNVARVVVGEGRAGGGKIRRNRPKGVEAARRFPIEARRFFWWWWWQ
jgi:hypothetical protein